MMMRLLVTLVLAVSLFETAKALKCNICVGSMTSDCTGDDNSKKAVQYCPDYSDSYDVDTPMGQLMSKLGKSSKPRDVDGSVCIQLSIGASESFGAAFQRSCIVDYNEEGFDLCELLISVDPSIDHCKTCKTDLCNSSGI